MTDVEFRKMGNHPQVPEICLCDAMPGIDLQSGLVGQTRRMGETFNLMRSCGIGAVGKASGMEFDHLRAGVGCSSDLVWLRIDEQTDPDAGLPEFGNRIRNQLRSGGNVESTLRGDLLAGFRHQTGEIRAQRARKIQHLAGDAHLQVERKRNFGTNAEGIGILHVTAVAPNVNRQGIRASSKRIQPGRSGIRLCNGGLVVSAVTRLAQGGNVIDINSEQHGVGGIRYGRSAAMTSWEKKASASWWKRWLVKTR